MTNPVHSWLDAEEVKRLSEKLLQTQPQQDSAAAEEAAFGADFIGFTGEGPAEASPVPPPPTPQPLPQPTPQAVPVAVTTPAPAPLPAPVSSIPQPHGRFLPLLERIGPYRDWMHTKFSATGLFLLDHEGGVIFDEDTRGRFHSLACGYARCPRQSAAAPGNVRIRIGTDAVLEIIAVDTSLGRLVQAAIVPHPLEPDAVQLVRQGLVHAIRQSEMPIT